MFFTSNCGTFRSGVCFGLTESRPYLNPNHRRSITLKKKTNFSFEWWRIRDYIGLFVYNVHGTRSTKRRTFKSVTAKLFTCLVFTKFDMMKAWIEQIMFFKNRQPHGCRMNVMLHEFWPLPIWCWAWFCYWSKPPRNMT